MIMLVSVLTIYTLFFDDIRVAGIEKTFDSIFYGLTASCFIVFSIEILFSSVCKEDYFLTFFFWLDLVSTISMLPDIGWVWDFVTG